MNAWRQHPNPPSLKLRRVRASPATGAIASVATNLCNRCAELWLNGLGGERPVKLASHHRLPSFVRRTLAERFRAERAGRRRCEPFRSDFDPGKHWCAEPGAMAGDTIPRWRDRAADAVDRGLPGAVLSAVEPAGM